MALRDEDIRFDDNLRRDRAMGAITMFLQALGLDIDCEDLRETPRRITDMYATFFRGLPDVWTHEGPPEITTFTNDEGVEEMVLLKDIEYVSVCSHHFLPFHGKAAIAYVPAKKIIGISKLARVLDYFAARPQLQERLTKQVADGIQDLLKPCGVAVRIWGTHGCISQRGAKKPDSVMVTTVMTGCFKDEELQWRDAFLREVNS